MPKIQKKISSFIIGLRVEHKVASGLWQTNSLPTFLIMTGKGKGKREFGSSSHVAYPVHGESLTFAAFSAIWLFDSLPERCITLWHLCILYDTLIVVILICFLLCFLDFSCTEFLLMWQAETAGRRVLQSCRCRRCGPGTSAGWGDSWSHLCVLETQTKGNNCCLVTVSQKLKWWTIYA